MYSVPNLHPQHQYANECGIDMCIVNGPTTATDPGDISFMFWALQVNWRNASNVSVAGGHFGLQWLDRGDAPKHHAINWGVYDDTLGNFATNRGSIPQDPRFVRMGGGTMNNTYGYGWDYGDWLRFRLFKSPKQNYTAAELDTGDLQVAPYVGTAQQANEEAWRLTVQNLTRHEYPVTVRDVLIKGPKAAAPLMGPIWWSEFGNNTTAPNYNPVFRSRHFSWDGGSVNVVPSIQAQYGSIANANVSAESGGYIRQEAGVTRAVAQDTKLVLPAGFYDTPPPNVAPRTPNPDTAPRAKTPLPLF